MSCAERQPRGSRRPLRGGSISSNLSSSGRRPRFSPRLQPHGNKSATPTSTTVNIKTETENGYPEVLQHSQMQNEAGASQSICQTKPSLSGGIPHITHDKLEDNEGANGLRRPPTPINLFEDECVFCHSFRTTKKFHGKMVQYLKGRTMLIDESNPTNAIYVHKKCLKWAPRVYCDGDIYVNVEKEISRASRLKCSRCRLPGAALGCSHHPSCARTYHVTCAMMIPECNWDTENRHVWCPNHASDALPRDGMSSPITESDITSSVLKNQYSDIEEIFANCPTEVKQINQSGTPVDQRVLLGSVLSASEKDFLKKFVSLTSSTLAEEWGKNVTHVIVGRCAADPSYEVLMAILSGKWVVTTGWIVDCLAEPIPGPTSSLAELIPLPEISYEVTSFDGPKKGRAGAAEGAPKLFSGLYFCLSAYMDPERTGNIKNLIAAAEGQVLEGMSTRSLQENLEKNPAKVYFIYDGGPPRDYASTLFLYKEIEEGEEYAFSGAHVISHCRLLDAIASYDARILERSHHFTPEMYAKIAL